ncbi:MAG TPA: metal-sulfur cluster assembly factor [Pirellulales bacterium]|nr:metal-sulfur cluster assembly factor [Pirellulales bacterium]
MNDIRYSDHTDSVARKLELLEAAYAAGKLDVAMSLAASLKETLSFERQLVPAPAAQLPASASIPVSKLPPVIAQWARGWSICKPVTLFETVGARRANDPVDVSLAFGAAEIVDPVREMRVAKWNPTTRRLQEIPSQVYAHTRHGDEVRCRVAFFAEVGAHDSASYLILAGNPNAERPDYQTDLRVTGEGYGLDVTNSHYQARLSRQTGQLERLTYRREHGLELYAGGKGHGEPPDIDWGHDYVDQGDFQKLRMRNWAECPSYEVTRGPLFVQLRRFGFPASPMHPLFTPSRMHMDVTYTFYAGLPYFLKHSRMDMVQDFRIEAMRDDEWVFSGYSFTDMLWIDSSGKLHEGAVPADQTEALWGVGFFNRTSRDAFVALRLVHEATGGASISHGGAPTMHYAGHGQLSSRYPAQKTEMHSGVSFEQKNAYLLAPYPEQNPAEFYEQSRHALLNPLEIKAEMPAGLAGAATNNRPLARDGETPDTASLKPAIWKVLREVRDEQLYTIDANVVDMGLIYDVSHRDGVARILMTMPHRGRPVYQFFVSQGGGRVSEGIRERLLKLAGVRDVVVDFTWEPAWSTARLTDAGRAALGLST